MNKQAQWSSLILVVLFAMAMATILLAYALTKSGANLNFFHTPSQQEVAFDNCLVQMQRQTCKIIFGPEIMPYTEIDTMWIAGYGEIDADAYLELKNSGLNMCHVFKERCDQAPHDELCRLAVNLFKDMK